MNSKSEMTKPFENPLSEKLIATGGLANVVGGVCVAIAYGLHPPRALPEVVASGFWIVIHVLFMVSLLGGVFALFAFLAAYLRNGGTMLGVVGCCMATLSLILIFGLDYAEVFIFPVLATTFPEVILEYGDGTTMPSIAFAFPASGTLVFGAGLSGFMPMIVVKIGAALFGLGLIWTGLSLYRNSTAGA
ncbi:MAG: hypothetical protein ACO3DT_04775 [Gammaproteobacteria bacterium]